MTTAKKLALIALGYVLALAGGYVAVVINEWRMPAEISQGSPGMVAFGDMILFLLAAGFLGLVPTLLLLKLWVAKAPHSLLAALLLVAAIGPACWLSIPILAGGPPVPHEPTTAWQLLGLFVAFGAIPRIVAGPVLIVIEGVAFFLVRHRVARVLLAAAMLMDFVPLAMFARHIVSHY